MKYKNKLVFLLLVLISTTLSCALLEIGSDDQTSGQDLAGPREASTLTAAFPITQTAGAPLTMEAHFSECPSCADSATEEAESAQLTKEVPVDKFEGVVDGKNDAYDASGNILEDEESEVDIHRLEVDISGDPLAIRLTFHNKFEADTVKTIYFNVDCAVGTDERTTYRVEVTGLGELAEDTTLQVNIISGPNSIIEGAIAKYDSESMSVLLTIPKVKDCRVVSANLTNGVHSDAVDAVPLSSEDN